MYARASEYIKREVDAKLRLCTKLYYACIAKAMLDKLGCTLEQVETVLRDVENTCDSVNQDYITFDDLLKMLKDEYGLEIKIGR